MPISFVAAGEAQSRKTKKKSRILSESSDKFDLETRHMMDTLQDQTLGLMRQGPWLVLDVLVPS